MSKLIGGTLTVLLVIVLAVLFVGSATIRFNLITVQPAFWLYLLGIMFVTGGFWLVSADIKFGKMFATLGGILLILGGIKSVWPNTSAATARAQETADQQAALAVNNTIAAKSIRCDRTSGTHFWDPVTGEAVVFYVVDEENRRIECANRKGFHPVTRKEYRPVTAAIVRIILEQDPPETPAPPQPVASPIRTAESPTAEPMVAPVASTAPTPLPDLSERPISEAMPPTPRPPSEYTVPAGHMVRVAVSNTVDLQQHGEGYQFEGRIIGDVISPDGTVLATSGARATLIVKELALDRGAATAYVKLAVVTITTTGGTPLPIDAEQMGYAAVHRARSIEPHPTVFGARIPQIEPLPYKQYMLPPGTLKAFTNSAWTVPASMVAQTMQ